MSSQQQPRPWFRLASMMRPPAPAPAPPPPTRTAVPNTVLQPTPPLPAFRPPGRAQLSMQPQEPPQPEQPPLPPPPPVVSPAPTTQATTPRSPVQLPVRLPMFSTPSASRSPVITSSVSTPVQFPTPASVPEPPSQPEPNKPQSPIISTTTSNPTTRQVASYFSPPASPKTNAAPPSPRLPTSPAPKTVISSPAPRSPPPPPPSPTPAHNLSPRITSGTAPPPPSPARKSIPSITTVTSPSPPSPARKSFPSITTATSPPPPSPVKPVPSPKSINQWDRNTPPDQSPILKPVSHPPSPLILPPPAQLNPDGSDYLEPIPAEAQQKTILTQNRANDKPLNHKTTTFDTSSYKSGNSHSNKHGGEVKKDTTNHILSKKTNTSSSEDKWGIRIVTLAGENKGAVMELSSHARKKGNNAQKFQGSGGILNDEDGKNGFRKMQSQAPAPVDAYVNSNVQGVNNSILHNCSYTNRNPGVHMSVTRHGGNGGRGAPHHLLKDSSSHD